MGSGGHSENGGLHFGNVASAKAAAVFFPAKAGLYVSGNTDTELKEATGMGQKIGCSPGIKRHGLHLQGKPPL